MPEYKLDKRWFVKVPGGILTETEAVELLNIYREALE